MAAKKARNESNFIIMKVTLMGVFFHANRRATVLKLKKNVCILLQVAYMTRKQNFPFKIPKVSAWPAIIKNKNIL